jgi:hypothetical protein
MHSLVHPARRVDARELRFANEELLAIFECADLDQLRDKLGTLGVEFYFQPLMRFVCVDSRDMSADMQARAGELFPYSWPPKATWKS